MHLRKKNMSSSLKEEMKNKLPSAASIGSKNDNTTSSYHENHINDDNDDDEMLAIKLIQEMPPNNLFVSCCFYLVGFGDDDGYNMTLTAEDTNYNTGNNHSREQGNSKKQLLRLLRRGMGTVFWDVHESITHVIVADGSDAKQR